MSAYHQPEGPIRTRMPRPGEIMGIVTQLHGGARMMVHCEDGKDRMCRVPGKIRRFIWVREGDYVLIVPWSVEGDEKADIAYRYTKVQSDQLKRQGVIKG
ncbi:translation initiation factor eIF-1A [Candidatus Micrarchaeota archaeon]|nr:translation initiation factor eIF-1A [Candidatus Micrarchaeota archaeon]